MYPKNLNIGSKDIISSLNIGSKDIISSLPEALIYHILSFLSTKEAAFTSLLSKKWRYLFAFVPNLDFDDPLCMCADLFNQEKTEIHRTFMDFVDRVLGLQGNFPVNSFSLKCGNGADDVGVTRWIHKVLELGVSDLDLRIALDCDDLLFPSQVFVSKSLVRLRIGARNGVAFGGGLAIDVEDVSLPKLKTLYIDSVVLGYEINTGLAKLLSGCHVLEELVLIDLWWNHWESCSLSVPALKRLTFCLGDRYESPESVTFDTPALVYFEYSDIVALKYATVNFDSLVEARLDLRVGYREIGYVVELLDDGQEVMDGPPFMEYAMVGDATDLLMGISNVQILYLSAGTVEVLSIDPKSLNLFIIFSYLENNEDNLNTLVSVLTFCCKAVPIFNNLTHLTIESNTEVGWDPLPNLLNKCPNLKALIFQGLHHKATDICGNMCRCKPWEHIPTCLSSSPVKVLKILQFGEKNDDEHTELEQIKHFLESMPHLEQLTIYYDTSIDDNLVKVSKELQKLPRVASQKCKIQVISNNISLSITVPSSSWIGPIL